jgi:transglutaminase-like putative cysteine protease
MRCPSCGRETSGEAFCEWCGKALKIARPAPIERKSTPQSDSKLGSSTAVDHTKPVAGGGDQRDSSNHMRLPRVAWAVLAIALYLVIADAAVETFLRDSPLRWWVAGTSVGYFGLCAVVWRLMPKLWRRLDWASQAALSLIVLLALMSATAWMPGGLEQGLNLLGQPTSIVLAAFSAVVVALSGILLVRLQFIPLAGKVVAGLLALYGVLAFVFAIGATTPYASLFHGQSQWTRLPFWLQGAVVGGLFVVPLALLLEIVTGLSRLTRSRISGFAFKVLALAMSLVITLSAVHTPEVYDADAIEPPPWLSKTSDEKLPQGEAGYKVVSERLKRIYAALDVVNSKIDRSLFEIDALADRLGSDPATIFHFVRDEIRYEPYVGVLRGPLGTLLCRAGNSLDRSLLLAALLQKAGLTTQIASGTVNSQQAQTLVNRLFEPVRPVPQAVPSIAALAPEVSKAMGVDQAKLLQLSDQMQQYGQKQNKQLMDYVDSESAYLSDLLSKAGVDAGVVTPNDQLVAEATQHYWVQYQNASGQWIDLDSAFTDAEPGKANTQVTNTFAPDAVPEELYHHLRVTLTLRVAQVNDGQDGQTTDTVLLDQELRVAEQQGKDIIVANVPDPMPDFMKAAGTLGDALAATKGFQTVFQAGDKATTGKYFDLNGRTFDQLPTAEGAVVNNASPIGGAFGGLTGNAGGALGGAQQMSTTRIVGQWVEYQLSSPVSSGGSPSVRNFHRDIIAPSVVEGWSASDPDNPHVTRTKLEKHILRSRLFWSAELLPVTGSITVDYPGYLTLKSFSESRAAVDALAKTEFGGSGSGNPASTSSRPPVTNLLLAEGATQLANNLVRARFPILKSYFGQSGLVAYERATGGTSDRLYSQQGYDIVAFSRRIVGNEARTTGEASRNASRLHILTGVIATRLEWALIAKEFGGTTGTPSFNATRVFAAAKEGGVSEVVLKPGTDGLKKLTSISVPESVKAELSATLATGNDVVVPVRPVLLDRRQQVAWWRLEPASGQVIGVMPGGRGQDMTEYMQQLWSVISGVMCLADAKRGSGAQGAAILVFCLASAVAFHEANEGWPASTFGANNPELMQFFDIISVGLFHCGESWFAGEDCVKTGD